MRAIKTSIICCALSGLTLTSCIGSYALFNKVRSWNEQATGSKFLNELIFVGLWIVPVYEVSMLADTFVLNSIEFWSGSNPVAAGTVEEVEGENGKYLVTTTEEGYTIAKEGEDTAMELRFDNGTQTWNVVCNGKSYEIMKLCKDGTVDLNMQNGQYINVTPDAQGVSTARDAIMGATFYAAR